jgi:hypothetical protein
MLKLFKVKEIIEYIQMKKRLKKVKFIKIKYS